MFIDGIFSLVKDAFLVGDGIVRFSVYHIIKGGDLREFSRNRIKKSSAGSCIFMVEADYQHDVSIFCRTDEHVAEEADMLAYVEECKPVIKGIFPYEKTDGIRRFRLKITMIDIQDLVEETSHMEAETIFFLL